MTNIHLWALMFTGGIAVALQPSINSRLAQKVGILESSLVSFAVGALGLLAVVLIFGKGSLRHIGHASWWELSGGFLGAFFVSMTIFAVPRIGTTAAMASVIAAQLATGVILDHYGFFGFRQVPLDPRRTVGVVLLLAGASLVFRK